MKNVLNRAVIGMALGLMMSASVVTAKLPPPPPPTPEQAAAAATKAEKDKATAEKNKADQARYEDKSVANYQGNMRKAGKPVPKPTPIVVAAPAAPAAPAKAVPAKK